VGESGATVTHESAINEDTRVVKEHRIADDETTAVVARRESEDIASAGVGIEYRSIKNNQTINPKKPNPKTRSIIAEKYGISSTEVGRLERIDKLTQVIKDQLDSKVITEGVADALSFLKYDEQAIVNELLSNGVNISQGQANLLKAESKIGALSEDAIRSILKPKSN